MESSDLSDDMVSVENMNDWIACPHCGSPDADLSRTSRWDDLRPIVECPECGANGYFD